MGGGRGRRIHFLSTSSLAVCRMCRHHPGGQALSTQLGFGVSEWPPPALAVPRPGSHKAARRSPALLHWVDLGQVTASQASVSSSVKWGIMLTLEKQEKRVCYHQYELKVTFRSASWVEREVLRILNLDCERRYPRTWAVTQDCHWTGRKL